MGNDDTGQIQTAVLRRDATFVTLPRPDYDADHGGIRTGAAPTLSLVGGLLLFAATFGAWLRLLKPDSGRTFLGDQELTRALPYERAAAGMGRTFQHIKLFPGLTVEENLLAAQHQHLRSSTLAAMLRLPTWKRDEEEALERVEAILELIDLDRYRRHKPGELSYGTLRFVELAAVLSLQPRILLLDEPASGIAQKRPRRSGPC